VATKVLSKDPNELKLFGVEFEDVLSEGDSLTGTPTVTESPSGLTIGSPSIDGSLVEFTIDGGTEDTMYVITVTAATVGGNSHEACVRLYVKDCSAFIEMLMMLRVMINDLDDTDYAYTDTRLTEVLLVAAKYVQQDVDLTNTYTINVRQQKISPDPTDDAQLVTLAVLKAACILDQGKLRNQALISNINAKCGPASLSVGDVSGAWKTIITDGACKAYEQLRDANNFGDFLGVHAILSPFNGNIWSPDDSYNYDNRFFR
jgi:hypothetical protein